MEKRLAFIIYYIYNEKKRSLNAMKKDVFLKEICPYCVFFDEKCKYIEDIVYEKQNDIEILRCNFYLKNIDK